MSDDTSKDSARSKEHRVLARQYRPQTFDDLIGQSVMVETLTNAFSTGRIAQAFMLTGLRGIGKTTTARILARALNFEPLEPDQPQGPTLSMPSYGRHCEEIIASRHIDVIEMDAASHTGIDDIRDIIENARYAPVSARYKVYIIDEVHMLSKAAFNGLLKTLEEPPPHVKFIFATTEIRKVPTTVLSRCQRYTLSRIDIPTMSDYLATICQREGIACEKEALLLIARAAEGSARDALSMLDQVMALSPDLVGSSIVSSMLGLAPKTTIIALFRALIAGQAPEALALLGERYKEGDDPATILADLAEFCHLVTRQKIIPESHSDDQVSEHELTAAKDLASQLDIRLLSRLWQMLVKGHDDVLLAPKALAAAEMVVIRLCYAAALPDPEDLISQLKDRTPSSVPENAASPKPSPDLNHTSAHSKGITQDWAVGVLANDDEPGTVKTNETGKHLPKELNALTPESDPMPGTLKKPDRPLEPSRLLSRFSEQSDGIPILSLTDLIALAESRRDLRASRWLRSDIGLVSLSEAQLDICLLTQGAGDLLGHIRSQLESWTGKRWSVNVHQDGGQPSLQQQEERNRAELLEAIRCHDAIEQVLDTFPDAEFIEITKRA